MELDRIPRSKKTTKAMSKAIDNILEPLEKVKKLNSIFDYLEPEIYRDQAEEALLKVSSLW